MEGKVQINVGPNVFSARSVYGACGWPDDIQTFGHNRMKTFHQLLFVSQPHMNKLLY